MGFLFLILFSPKHDFNELIKISSFLFVLLIYFLDMFYLIYIFVDTKERLSNKKHVHKSTKK
jgi:hypothetical protein